MDPICPTENGRQVPSQFLSERHMVRCVGLMPSPPHFIPPAQGSADISMTRFSLTYSRVLVLSCTGHDGVLGEPVTGKASASKSAVYVQTAFAVLIEHGEYLVCQFPPPVYGTKSSGM
jgi:hypothetical protein